jgi:hypothetical protein
MRSARSGSPLDADAVADVEIIHPRTPRDPMKGERNMNPIELLTLIAGLLGLQDATEASILSFPEIDPDG